MKLGIVTDVQVVEHQGRLVSPSAMLPQVAAFCPYFEEVLIFSPPPPVFDPGGSRLYRVEKGNIRVVAIPGFRPRKLYGFLMTWPGVWAGLRRVLRQADLVNIRMPSLCGLVGRALCAQMRIPYFVSIHGDAAEQFRIARARGGWRWILPYLAWVRKLDMLAVARNSVVFATSREILEQIQPVARSVHLIFSTLLNESDLAAQGKELDRSRPLRLLYVGQVAIHKGMGYAFEAMRLLADRGVAFEFHVVGDGPLIESGREFARQHGLEKRFVFHGFVPHGSELMAHYARADIFVFPSLSEGSPKVMFEAMAQGVPVVATRVGGIPDYACDGIHGRLVEARSPERLTEAVMELTTDAAWYFRASQACLETASELTLAAVTAGWVDQLADMGLYRLPGRMVKGGVGRTGGCSVMVGGAAVAPVSREGP